MSFDLGLYNTDKEVLFFTIGYSAWGLLDTIFDHKSFWFDNLNEKDGKNAIPYIEKAIVNLNKLPENGIIREKEYSKERYIALQNQLNHMLKNSKEYNSAIWDISL